MPAKLKATLLFLLAIISASANLHADSNKLTLSLPSADENTLPYLDLAHHLYHLKTEQTVDTLNQALEEKQWTHLEGKTNLRNAGLVNWFRLELAFDDTPKDDLILEVSNSLLDRVDFFLVENGREITQYTTGADIKLSTRPIQNRKLLFPLPEDLINSSNADSIERYIYLKVQSTGMTYVPLHLWHRDSFIHFAKIELLFCGLFLGAMFIIGVYHLFLFFRIPKLYILFYCIAVFCVGFQNFIRWGYGLEYLWPEAPLPIKPTFFFVLGITSAGFCQFIYRFMGLNHGSKFIQGYFNSITFCFLAITLTSPFITPLILVLPSILLTLVMHCSNIVASIILWKQGNSTGKYYLLAVMPMLIGALLYVSSLMGITTTSVYTSYIAPASLLAMVCFFALALAHKIRNKQEQAQSDIEKLNEELEQRVVERTEELNQSLTTLKRTQQQLIESEKVAALTGLVSGVAHEINTPIGVGITAASSLKSNCDGVVDRYQNNELSRSDMENYFSNTQESLDLIENSFNRAAKLVSSFKGLSIDKSRDDQSSINLREIIEKNTELFLSTTAITAPEIHIQCDRDLIIQCSPKLIDQLLLQLLNNSAQHAFENDQKGNIYIDAYLRDSLVNLNYRDDGKGIDENEIADIFNPFTTSSRGSGHAGLGTTVIHNIAVQGLHGAINCESPPGQGLAYYIEFPVTTASIEQTSSPQAKQA